MELKKRKILLSKKKEKDAATIISFADVVFIRLLVESTGKIFYGGITHLYG